MISKRARWNIQLGMTISPSEGLRNSRCQKLYVIPPKYLGKITPNKEFHI